MADEVATVERVQKLTGVAGGFSIRAWVSYPGEETSMVEFAGSVYGAPVVMIQPSGVQVFVTEPGRFGEFTPKTSEAWVRRFFGTPEVTLPSGERV